MKFLTQTVIVVFLNAISILLFTKVADAKNIVPGANAKAEVAVLKTIKPQANFDQIRKLLPKNMSLGKAKWSVFGNAIQMRGTVNGTLYFFNNTQRKMMRAKGLNALQGAITKFRNSDPVNMVSITMDSGRISSQNDARKRIEAVVKFLGRPVEYENAEAIDDFAGGWFAKWTTSTESAVKCGNYYEGSEKPSTKLILTFSNTVVLGG